MGHASFFSNLPARRLVRGAALFLFPSDIFVKWNNGNLLSLSGLIVASYVCISYLSMRSYTAEQQQWKQQYVPQLESQSVPLPSPLPLSLSLFLLMLLLGPLQSGHIIRLMQKNTTFDPFRKAMVGGGMPRRIQGRITFWTSFINMGAPGWEYVRASQEVVT